MTTEYSNQAIQAVLNGQRGFCKFFSANDTGATEDIRLVYIFQNHL